MSIQIRKAHVRQAPPFLSTVAGTLPYGRRVHTVEQQEDWIHITCWQTGISGWLHTSTLTPKKIILNAGDRDVPLSATSEEYALAGKGFNREVEQEFRTRHPHLNFTWINRMETYIVSGRHKQTFLASGGLAPERGR